MARSGFKLDRPGCQADTKHGNQGQPYLNTAPNLIHYDAHNFTNAPWFWLKIVVAEKTTRLEYSEMDDLPRLQMAPQTPQTDRQNSIFGTNDLSKDCVKFLTQETRKVCKQTFIKQVQIVPNTRFIEPCLRSKNATKG